MAKFVNSIMLSCSKATELIEKEQLLGLSFGERLQLKTHKMMCDACRNYEKQSVLIESILKKLPDKPGEELKTEAEFKKNIKEKINKS